MPFSGIKNSLFILAHVVCAFTVSAAQTQPSTTEVCAIPSYKKIPTLSHSEKNNGLVIHSNTTSIDKNEIALFEGDVTLTSIKQSVRAQKLEFNRKDASFKALGSIQYQSKGINVFADDLSSSKGKNKTQLSNTSYQLDDSPGHGSAGAININNSGELSLVDSSFTTCAGDTPAWQLVASEINISADDNFGEAFNARLHILNVPVLYIPYFTFPVTNQRKSGFLYPSFNSSSKSGATIALPFYWNISENYDATIIPKFMSKRGTQLLTEFRYLSGQQSGEINVEYLNKDNEYLNDDARYLARIQHTGTFSENYRAYFDATTISDDNYLVDIGSEHYNSNDAYLYQIGELSYFGDDWNLTAKIQDFEILGNHQSSYRTLPQLELNKQSSIDLFNGIFDIHSEISKFTNNDKTQPEAERYHIEAGFMFPISTPAWFLNSEFKVMQTNYSQKNLTENSALKRTVNRTLPKIRLHGGINFDRTMDYKDYTQTLEPQLQYLYIPNKDQSGIGLYDSAPLQDDYAGLFRDKRYSGLDRISEANQYSWGVTSRILNPSNDEVFRFSLGRIVYLNNRSTDNNDTLLAKDKSALAAETFFQIDRQWQLSGNIQYNTETRITDKSQLNIDYHYSDLINAQLNHRYIRNVSGVSLEQLSFLSSLKINEDWRFVGRISQDLKEKRSIESYAGFQYESCCWSIRFAYHRHIDTYIDTYDDANIISNNLNSNRGEFDSRFMIQFDIKGLSGQSSTLNSDDMLNTSIFGYKRPYFLNN